jgi:hypothetical protein
VDFVHCPALALKLLDCGFRGGAPAEDEIAALGMAGDDGVSDRAAGFFGDDLTVGKGGGEGGHGWWCGGGSSSPMHLM